MVLGVQAGQAGQGLVEQAAGAGRSARAALRQQLTFMRVLQSSPFHPAGQRHQPADASHTPATEEAAGAASAALSALLQARLRNATLPTLPPASPGTCL